jgi:hypothetical protein
VFWLVSKGRYRCDGALGCGAGPLKPMLMSATAGLMSIEATDMAALGLPPLVVLLHYGRTREAVLDQTANLGIRLHPLPW